MAERTREFVGLRAEGRGEPRVTTYGAANATPSSESGERVAIGEAAIAILMECDGLAYCWTQTPPGNPLRGPVRESEVRITAAAQRICDCLANTEEPNDA